MGTVVRTLFWLWVIGSMVVLVVRWQTRRQADDAAPGPSPGSTPSGTPERPRPTGTTSTRPAPMVERTPPPTPPSAPEAPGAPGPAWSATGAGDAPGGSARAGLFASAGSVEQVATIAEALEGISLPCGLTPVIGADAALLVDKRVVFSTTEAEAGEVGAAVGDALEALGYDLRSIDEATAVAVRDDATVELGIVARASLPDGEGRPRYPTLPEDAVVLECELRAR